FSMHSTLSSIAFTYAFTIILLVQTYGVSAANWGYGKHNGPVTWEGACKTGLRQTPIDIRSTDTDYSFMDRISFANYDQTDTATMQNNGHSISIADFHEWDNPPFITGGALQGKYNLLQFHLHWGQKDHEGSEHKIGGLSYPAELHLVHIKEGLNITEALKRGDGLAVVGVFLNIDNNSGPLSAVTKSINEVINAGNETEIKEMRPRSLLPSVTDAFYRYEGSLTTPGCQEAVQWILLAEPVSITRDQLDELRKVRNTEGEVHEHNFRPTYPLNGRRIRFRPAQYDRLRFCSSSYSLSFFITVIVTFLARTFF
ncbi:cah-5, partial [Pristionchus pacificus]